jgi:ribosomal protein S18 acetylase RimI-like enzyme
MNIKITNTIKDAFEETTNVPFGSVKPYRKKKAMECVLEEVRRNCYGELDGRITKMIKLAKSHKFYWKTIQGILDSSKRQGICFNPRPMAIISARIENKIVGFIIFSTPDLNGEYVLSSSADYWLVDEKFRGYGIGKALWNVYEMFHKRFSGRNMWVNFKRGDEELERLYTQMGFKEIEMYGGKTQDTRKMDYEERQCKEHHKWWKIDTTHLEYPMWYVGKKSYNTPFNKYRGCAVIDLFTGKDCPTYYLEGKMSYEWFVKFGEVLTAIKKE